MDRLVNSNKFFVMFNSDHDTENEMDTEIEHDDGSGRWHLSYSASAIDGKL